MTQSKYDHHSAAATTIPSRAAAILGGIERQPGRADADRDDRLSEGDDDDQPVTLDEVRRRETPAPPAADQRAR